MQNHGAKHLRVIVNIWYLDHVNINLSIEYGYFLCLKIYFEFYKSIESVYTFM